ncbi:4-hydroxy-tetrahydrodipicolinate synthase [Ichthyobacterium seriolicida]|uniref:4-hydroxy-tetrahydrodipicolinate synthase n=1 Tax=Ichthyobacterium seriolicida TaxID=242600 RepID=A0A1J1E5E2_9FLAO|nr:4-hydroxy-tetrahydrodipicolinate synthase [Ichthyobacterium seriolicida]BAV94526.1 dihydrodipicolinate synthase [Ichthyobacterium seriolicida]
MKNFNIEGVGVALTTPFSDDLKIDYDSLEKLIEHTVNNVDYLVVCGTTSEYPSLTSKEIEDLIAFIKKVNDNRLPMVLGMAGNNTEVLVKKIKTYDLSQFSAILSSSPHYNKPSQEGIYRHYKSIAENCPIDIVLYDVPSRTGSNIHPDTTVRLGKEFKNIIAIKDASGHINNCMNVINEFPRGMKIISGDDGLTIPMISVGARGCISVIANAYPQETTQMVENSLNNNYEKANEIWYKLMNISNLIFEEGNPTGIKHLLKLLGIFKTDKMRLPLVGATDNLKSKLSHAVQSLKV